MPKARKNIVNYNIFAFGKQAKKQQKIHQKVSTWTPETHLGILASLFPPHEPPKNG